MQVFTVKKVVIGSNLELLVDVLFQSIIAWKFCKKIFWTGKPASVSTVNLLPQVEYSGQ
jgi:hypothetical protein